MLGLDLNAPRIEFLVSLAVARDRSTARSRKRVLSDDIPCGQFHSVLIIVRLLIMNEYRTSCYCRMGSRIRGSLATLKVWMVAWSAASVLQTSVLLQGGILVLLRGIS